MKKLKSAIIGCGNIFKMHAEAITKNNFSELVAVVDINKDKAEEAGTKYNCKSYTDYRKVIKDSSIDVIHICTPHYLHAPMAIEALKIGKHVFTEKPIAIDVEAAEEMIKTAVYYNRHLGVCFQNRYNNTSVMAKKLLDEGKLGRIKGVKGIVTWHRDVNYYINSGWRGKWKTEGGGVLINQSIHTLDLLQWFAGPVKNLKAHVDTRVLKDVIEVEDTADVTLNFENGAVGIFYATTGFSEDSPVDIEINCENGTLRINNGKLYLAANNETKVIEQDYSSALGKSYWGNSHERLIAQFYKCIEENSNNYVTGEDGIVALKLIKKIYQSSKEGEFL